MHLPRLPEAIVVMVPSSVPPLIVAESFLVVDLSDIRVSCPEEFLQAAFPMVDVGFQQKESKEVGKGAFLKGKACPSLVGKIAPPLREIPDFSLVDFEDPSQVGNSLPPLFPAEFDS